MATPAFGSEHTVVRLAGARLVVERASSTAAVVGIDGATLRRLAAAAAGDLDADFAVGDDTPPLGDPDEPLVADHAAALAIGAWFAVGARVLDEVLADHPGASRPQLWPEHFDLGCDVPVGTGAGDGDRANLGASPGDAGHAAPYLYVGPWSGDRPGDPAYWNAPFGATIDGSAIASVADGVGFVRRGIGLLGGEHG